MKNVFRLHEIQKLITSNRDAKFTSNFWKALFEGLETQPSFSTMYHPQNDGQMERTNQILEDMLHMYVINKPTKWEDYLHIVEFTYNNSYQASLKMSHFEFLYGRKRNVLINLDNSMDRMMLGLDILKDLEQKTNKVKKNLKIAQDKKKVVQT